MAVARLQLSPAEKVAATGDKSQGQEHSEDGRESRREARPMYVDEAKAVVGLIQGNIVVLVMDLICDTKIRFILEHNGRGGCGCS